MKNWVVFTALFSFVNLISCNGQNTTTKMTTNKVNPLICDLEKGVCETSAITQTNPDHIHPTNEKQLRIVYFTDPICSSCWGIEPQLRKLKLEYGDFITFEYHMGGLLPSWHNYSSGPISEPADVAHHWDEVSAYYEMPIDGDIWLEDPLSSSYPASIAFKAAELQQQDKALKFLRRIREMVFLEKKNIAKWEYLQKAAAEAELDTAQLLVDYNGKAQQLFQTDLALAKQLGVTGFPSIFISNATNVQATIYGYKSYDFFEKTIKTLAPELQKKTIINTNDYLFNYYPTLTLKEFSVLGNYSKADAANILNELVKKNEVEVLQSKNGALWKRKK